MHTVPSSPTALATGHAPHTQDTGPVTHQARSLARTVAPIGAQTRRIHSANSPAAPGTQPPAEATPCSGRALTPVNRTPLLSCASDSEQRQPPGGDHQTQTPAAVIDKTASQRAGALPDSRFSQDSLRTETLNQRMLGHLCTTTPIDDIELMFHAISRHVSFVDQEAMLEINPETLGTCLLQERPQLIRFLPDVLSPDMLGRLMANPALATHLMRSFPYSFCNAPQEIKTLAVLAPLMASMLTEKRNLLLACIAVEDLDLALSLAPAQDIIRAYPRSLLTILPRVQPQERIGLCETAIERNVCLIESLKGMVDDCDYQKLCDRALTVSGWALLYMDDNDRTAERVDKAVAHRLAPPPGAIPKPLVTEKRLRLALKNTSGRDCVGDENTQSSAFYIRWKLWDALLKKENWLNFLPRSERTDALCCYYIAQNPARAANAFEIPYDIEKRHPQWQDGLYEPSLYLPLETQSRNTSHQVHAARVTARFGHTSSNLSVCLQRQPEDGMAPWALLLTGSWNRLPDKYKQLIWRNGGTAGLADAFNAPPFRISPQALLDPVQEQHCTNRAAWLPEQVARKLLFAGHFRPRNAALGRQLHRQMVNEAQSLRRDITTGQLEVLTPTGNWTLRGGRTLVRTTADGCLHMKFQRQGESLHSFAAEQSVQNFAQTNNLGWHSEIPQPEGMRLVPLDSPVMQRRSFPDTPKIYSHQGRQYALAFLFTTADSSYDTLAWQPDEQGGYEQAQQGLLRAFHDLGIWSSLGAVHTSTIRLYHHFLGSEDSRPELLLSEFFRPGARGYPGTLHRWNSQATAQSDWGESGLRDLGDMEFYGFIHSYVASPDAVFMVPDYGQRASFVNAIAQNILGGLLHYMRLHRDCDPDYHYKKTQSVAQLAQFIEQACDALLAGLLGKGVRLKEVFATTQEGLAEVYPEWLRRTAEEIIYWSAKQQEGGDCFAEHLKNEGRPCADLYPGHPWQNVTYGPHYTEADGENLGANNSKLPLFFLVRGLYVLAAGIADRLSETDRPAARATPCMLL